MNVSQMSYNVDIPDVMQRTALHDAADCIRLGALAKRDCNIKWYPINSICLVYLYSYHRKMIQTVSADHQILRSCKFLSKLDSLFLQFKNR